jgi:hypothetical protein
MSSGWWVLESLLGKGGFGEVWKAHHPHLRGQPPVALKFCLDLDSGGRDLLRHEAGMARRGSVGRADGCVFAALRVAAADASGRRIADRVRAIVTNAGNLPAAASP